MSEVSNWAIADRVPETISRPLSRIGERAFAAAWVAVESLSGDETEAFEKSLVLVSSDGRLYADTHLPGALPLDEIGATVVLPEEVPESSGWSGAGVKRYLDGERPDGADVFERVVSVVDRFLDFERSLTCQRTLCELVACYVLGTYFLDAFHVVGYLWASGDKGAGKTQALVTVSEVAYLGQVILSGGTLPSLRDLASYGACLAFDDAEDVAAGGRLQRDKRALLLAGNRKGTTLPLKEYVEGRWRTRHVHGFCPRIFSAIELPDETLGSRAIFLPLVRSSDKRKTDADPLDHASWPCDRRRLIDDLWALGLRQLQEMKRYDATAASRSRLSGRNLDPWRMVLAVGLFLEERHGVSALFARLEELSVDHQAQRAVLGGGDLSRLVIQALCGIAAACPGEDPLEFEARDVAARIDTLARKEGLDEDTELSTKRIGMRLRRLRIGRGRRRRLHRPWTIARRDLEALARSYAVGQKDPG